MLLPMPLSLQLQALYSLNVFVFFALPLPLFPAVNARIASPLEVHMGVQAPNIVRRGQDPVASCGECAHSRIHNELTVS